MKNFIEPDSSGKRKLEIRKGDLTERFVSINAELTTSSCSRKYQLVSLKTLGNQVVARSLIKESSQFWLNIAKPMFKNVDVQERS